ncbi:hypothetical protein [uncultured Marinobacter sp.]|uniref:hypothetical protein n=1 Tax=uncultured Marinobacter sp. TaxID=187379 RepID=UPI002627C965|nr:hypothetical protein [uncultured Marinobacter sp.]
MQLLIGLALLAFGVYSLIESNLPFGFISFIFGVGVLKGRKKGKMLDFSSRSSNGNSGGGFWGDGGDGDCGGGGD